MNTEHDAFARKIAEQLDASCNELDTRTRTRLRGMRRRAIEQATHKPAFWTRGLPVLAFASVAAIALGVVLWPVPDKQHAQTMASDAIDPSAPVEILAPEAADEENSDEYPIAFEEDLEFYQWLDQELGDS